MFAFFEWLFGRSDKWDSTPETDESDPEDYYKDDEPFTIMDFLKRH